MSPYSCNEPRDANFEDPNFPFGTWLPYSSNQFINWAIKARPEPIYSFLPSIDHTFKNETGKYIFITSNENDQLFSVAATIFSEQYPPTNDNGYCFTFYYQIKGGKSFTKQTSWLMLT